MSWLELDDGILEHPKFIRAVKLGGSEAVHLWLGLRAYCGKHLTDGSIPKDMLDEVRGPTNPKKRTPALAALFTVGLLEDHGDAVVMHDFLHWSSSREAVLAARERARERKAKSRGSHAVTPQAVTPVVTNPSPLLSSSTPEREDPPSPPATDRRSGAGERCLTAMTAGPPARRPDVQQVYEAWKKAFRLPAALVIRDGWDGVEARHIATAIDHHGLDQCLIVAAEAPDDGMVSGRTDENKVQHGSVSYIFGNETSFNRILAAGLKRQAARSTESPSALIDRMKKMPAGAA